MKNYVLIGFIVLMFVLYAGVLPVVKRRQSRQQQAKLSAFQESLSVDDQVMLAAGIIGRIKGIGRETIALEIAHNTVVDVDRLAIVGRISEK